MKHAFTLSRLGLAAAIAGAALVALPAQAALMSVDFSVAVDSGHYARQTFSGQAIYDDDQATKNVFDDPAFVVTALDLDFGGLSYNGALPAGASLLWTMPLDGGTPGLEGTLDFLSFVPGAGGGVAPSFGYDFLDNRDPGLGTVRYDDAVPVPEPASLALAAAALLGLGAARRSSRRRG